MCGTTSQDTTHTHTHTHTHAHICANCYITHATFTHTNPCLHSNDSFIRAEQHNSPKWRHGCSRQRHVTYYGVATISRLLQIIGLFGKRDLEKRQYSAKETYNLKEPTSSAMSHTMGWLRLVGSLKLKVSFVENSLFYRALLQKRPTI